MRFREIQLTTADPTGLTAFYQDVIGLPPAGTHAVQAGATRIGFVAGEPATYHFAFNIPENRITEAAAWLRERVPLVPYQGEEIVDFRAWNAHSIYFFDPAGNIVELIARHRLPNATSAPFGPEHFLSVSEMGLPVPAVAPVVEALAEHPGVPLWSGNRENFAAVGDEEGLFIVVPEGRVWLMTEDLHAGLYPLAVTIASSPAGTVAGLPSGYRVETSG